ncbi:MAG: hypothetical protein Q8S84_01785 [bacterium]|nr:hypothetical protein [bacterium]
MIFIIVYGDTFIDLSALFHARLKSLFGKLYILNSDTLIASENNGTQFTELFHATVGLATDTQLISGSITQVSINQSFCVLSSTEKS